MKRKSFWLRNISIFLIVCLCIQICSLQINVFAAEVSSQIEINNTLSSYLKNIVDTSEIEEIIEEVPSDEANTQFSQQISSYSLRGNGTTQNAASAEADTVAVEENELVLQLKDNTNSVYIFDEDIKYTDENGEIQYKETTIIDQSDSILKEQGYQYTNGTNNVRMNFSTDYSKGIVITDGNGTKYSFAPIPSDDSDLKIIGKKTKTQGEAGDIDAFEYENIFGKGTVLRYVPQLNACKEEIILPAYTGQNKFSFYFDVGENKAEVTENNEVVIKNKFDDVLVTLQPIFAYDSFGGWYSEDENHYTNDCQYSLKEESSGKYILTVEVSEKFLTNSEIIYPVTIDPVTANIGNSMDTAVYSGAKEMTIGAEQQIMFGRSPDFGLMRALVKFNIPTAIKSGATINSATYWARELTGRTTSTYVRPFIVRRTWDNNTTWLNRPNWYADSGMTRKNINSNSTDGGLNQYWYKFELKTAVKKWVDGTVPNYGIQFTSEEESLTDYKARAFSTREYPSSDMRGYVIINYTNDATAPTITSVTGNPTSWTKSNVTLTVNGAADGTGSGLHATAYSFDDGSTWQASNAKSFSSNQTVKIKVRDKMGNIYSHAAIKITKIDKTKPTITEVQNSVSEAGDVTLTIAGAEDAASGLHETPYSFDGGTTWQSESSMTFSSAQTVNIQVKDSVGNVYTHNALSVDIVPVIPTVPPAIYENYGILYIRNDNPQGTANPLTIEYYIGENQPGDNDWITYTDPISPVRSANSKIYARVKDSFGNVTNTTVLELPETISSYNTTKEDLVFGNITLPIALSRSYSSLDDQWMFSFESTLTPLKQQYLDEEGIVQEYVNENILEFVDPDGIRKYFTKVADNQYVYALYESQADKTTAEEESAETIIFADDIYTLTTDTLTYQFTEDGYLKKITGKDGYVMNASVVETDGTISSVTLTTEMGKIITVAYQNGRPSSITDHSGRTVSYQWTDGKLTSFQNARPYTEIYQYDTAGNLTQDGDTTVEYDSDGRVTKITNKDNSYISYAYNDAEQKIIITDSKNRSVTLTYDDAMNLTSLKDVDGVTVSFSYDNAGRLIQETSDEALATYGYLNNDMISQTTTSDVRDGVVVASSDTTTHYTYDENNQLISVNSTDGESEEYIYDEDGVLTEEENTYSDEDYVETSETQYTYYDNGRVKSSLSTTTDNETDEIIKTYTIYEYDNNGYISKSTEIDLSDTTYTYTMTEYVNSEVGCILRETIHSGICTEAEDVYTYIEEGTASVNTYQYNAMCEQTSQTMNAGTEEAVTSTYIYDSAGNITQQIEDEDTTTYNYDTTTGQLVSQTDPFGTVTTYEYDTVGNLTNQNFNIYKVTYNILDSLSSISIGNNNLVTYSYTEDVNQNLTRETYANGQSISYDYADNNITTTTFSGDNSARYENFYDEEGNLTSRVDYKNQTITEYSEDITATYSYVNNTKGDLIYKVDNSTVSDDETSSNIIETFGSQILTTTYNENNTQFAFESGITLVKTFTNDDETNTGTDTFKIGDTILLTRTDTSDTNGVVTQRTETYSGGAITQQYTYTGENVTSYVKNNKTTRYTYDDNDQIIRVDDEAANLTWTYTYDNRGNLTSKKEYAYTTGELTGSPTSSIVYEYDNDEWTDQLTKYNNSTITYDAVGNPLSYLGWNMTWEGGRQLKQMTHGNTTISYQYNADGLRTSKTVNGTTIRYYYGDNGIAYQTDGITNMYFLYDELGELIGVNINGATYLYLKDELGQILGMVDSAGNLVVEYKYDAWGKLLGISGSAASTIGEWNPIRYKDYYYDVETGYYYLQSRYYNPDVGRFINADNPIILTIDQKHQFQHNLYSYCLNNPVMQSDPSGHLVIALGVSGVVTLSVLVTTSLAAFASTKQVRNALSDMCKSLGKAISAAWKWFASLFSSPEDEVARATAETASASIKKVTKNQKKVKYWSVIRVEFKHKNGQKVFKHKVYKGEPYVYETFIPIKAVSKETAQRILRKYDNVFAASSGLAKQLARSVSKSVQSCSYRCENTANGQYYPGYFYHYHPFPAKNGKKHRHVFYPRTTFTSKATPILIKY